MIAVVPPGLPVAEGVVQSPDGKWRARSVSDGICMTADNLETEAAAQAALTALSELLAGPD